MDTLLVSVTLLSLGLAGAMGVLVARLLREERRRSDARVEALVELAAEPASEHAVTKPPVRRAATAPPAAPARSVATRAASEPARRAVPAAQAEPAASTPIVAGTSAYELELRPANAVRASDIFAQPERTSSWGRRLAVIGSLAAAAAILLAALAWPSGGVERGEPAPAAARPSSAQAAALELVSLRHTQEGDTLTIAGVVHNPRAGSPLTRISVTAVLFDAGGTQVASGQAPLDYTALGPGDESPFVITVPVRAAIARYRVGFKSQDGNVVAHVDRRPADVNRAGL